MLGPEKVEGILENLRKKGATFQPGPFLLQLLQNPLAEIVGAGTAKVILSMVEDEIRREALDGES